MKKLLLSGLGLIVVVFFIYSYYKSNYNGEVKLSEGVSSQWSTVGVAYQKRLDLIPNLVTTVKMAANFEKSTLVELVEARAKATSIQINPQNLSPQALSQFTQAQEGVGSALSRLLVTVENYPTLKANQNFLELQAQLEGVENRIAVERRKFNEVTKEYNTFVRQFPRSFLFKWATKPYFEHSQGAAVAPKINL